LPIVLYSGTRHWHSAEELMLLFRDEPDELGEYRPRFRYLLIDEGSYDDEGLACQDNLVAMLFRLENCRRYDRLEGLVGTLIEHLRRNGQDSLRQAFGVWLDKVIFARLSGNGVNMMSKVWEKEAMLSERFDEWEAELRQEGRQEGEAMLLVRLLQKRFGELPASIHARLQSATPKQLEYWGERLLDATSLNELFNGDATTLSESH
jgi:uncharacterized protein DUF4351/putative YhgA-like transposase